MAKTIETNWSILNLTSEISDGVVVIAYWECTAKQIDTEDPLWSGQANQTGGKLRLGPTDPTSPGFIPFKDLTEADVLKWLFDTLGEKEKAKIEADQIERVEKQINPTTQTGVPWN